MTISTLKTLFRKKGTISSILAIALLVAMIASMNSIINYFNTQTEALVEFPNIGGTYIVLNEISSAERQIDAELTDRLNAIPDVKYTIPQITLSATLAIDSENHTVLVRGVEDVSYFLKLRKGSVEGTAAKNKPEANVGEILARTFSLNLGDEATVTFDNNRVGVVVVGIVKTLTQTDAEIILPMESVNSLTGNSDTISVVEFALEENTDPKQVINQITELLPKDAEAVEVQKPKEFLQDLNRQTLTFLNVWALVVYAVVIAASYVVATRLITESTYEMAMLRALGAKKSLLLRLVLAYTVTTALLGCVLGLALGTSGTQAASTMLGWLWPSVQPTTSLEPTQALQALLLTLVASALGCLVPAVRSMHRNYLEQPL